MVTNKIFPLFWTEGTIWLIWLIIYIVFSIIGLYYIQDWYLDTLILILGITWVLLGLLGLISFFICGPISISQEEANTITIQNSHGLNIEPRLNIESGLNIVQSGPNIIGNLSRQMSLPTYNSVICPCQQQNYKLEEEKPPPTFYEAIIETY